MYSQGLGSCVCDYIRCINRVYVYRILDLFMACRTMGWTEYSRRLCAVFLFTMPWYVRPALRFICAVREPTATHGIADAVVAYNRVEEQICVRTRTSTMMCRCVHRLGQSRARCTCNIVAEGGCLLCTIVSCCTGKQSPVLPLSFTGILVGFWVLWCGVCMVVVPWMVRIVDYYGHVMYALF